MSNYRQQSGGSLGSLTTCPTCYDTLNLILGTNETDFCCDPAQATSPPFFKTVYVAQGQTFSTATMFYSDTSLTTVSPDGWFGENLAIGSRKYRRLTKDASGNNPALGSVTTCGTCFSTQSNIKKSTIGAADACCGSNIAQAYKFPYGKTFMTASYIYSVADSTLSSPLIGSFYSVDDDKVKQFNGSSQAGTPNSCPTCSETLTGIRYSNIDAEDVCCDITTTGTYYVAQGETFETATTFYMNSSLTTVAPGGFYSND